MTNDRIQFLSTIHGNDGSRNVGAYDSSDPATNAFNATHGFLQLNTIFCKDRATPTGPRAIDGMDLDVFQKTLDDRWKYPEGSFVMIDREGELWRELAPQYDTAPSDAKGSFLELMQLAKATRPDCTIGYYGMQNRLPYYSIQNAFRSFRDNPISLAPRFAERNEYVKPIIEASDAIFPNFYLPNEDVVRNQQDTETKVRPYEEVMIDWVEHSIMLMQRHFPNTLIVPLLWYQNVTEYLAILKEHPNCQRQPDFVWTPELLDRMFVPGTLWRKLLELVTSDGVVIDYTDPPLEHPVGPHGFNIRKATPIFATWGEGSYIPFGDAPWWSETLSFFKEHDMAIPEAVQAALDAVVAADEAKDAAATTLTEKKAALLAAIEAEWPE